MSRLKDIREPWRCPRPNGISKVSYRSHAKAALATRLIMSKGGPRFYAYECPLCGDWHLTKQEQRRDTEP